MSKELLILRHAKSDWDADVSHDMYRPLNKRGKKQAKQLGQWMALHQLLPDQVYCSPAKRAKKTLKHVLKQLDAEQVPVDYSEGLYLADLDDLLEVICSTPDSVQRLLLIGHNPGLDHLLLYLSNVVPPYTHNGKLMTTANLAWLQLPNNFQQIQEHCATLKQLLRPNATALETVE